MLAAWFRMKYPHLLDGAIAASAPIWTFLGEDPAIDTGAFAKTVTRDAWPEGGSSHDCAGNVRVRGGCGGGCFCVPEGETLSHPQLQRLVCCICC
jgi:hypothetical protein